MRTTTLSRQLIDKLFQGKHPNPFKVLGMHEVSSRDEKKAIIVRALLPHASRVFVVDVKKQQRYHMDCLDKRGLFEALFSRRRAPFTYQFEIHTPEGDSSCENDPYAFPSLLSDNDLHIFQKGRHTEIYKILGSHPIEHHGICGTRFAVWAPNAKRVSVIGAFNNWDGRRHQMRLRKNWGVWELFIPGIESGTRYQYEILSQDNMILTKSDPYGFCFEQPPDNSSIVIDLNHFEWTDHEWLTQRSATNSLQCPLSIYEVHLGSWVKTRDTFDGNGFLNYRELAAELIPYVKSMGFSHIELLPVTEHPFYGSWGYQVTGYYAPSSRYGSPEDFKFFMNECHRQGIGIIVDWVPAHFPKDDFSLGNFDGTCLYEYKDPQKAEHKDWGTLIFDYGRNEVKNFLFANAVFWMKEYHIDGLRVDAVASMLYLDYSRRDGEWTPNRYGGRENLEAIGFLRELNSIIRQQCPGTMTFAEESTSWLGVTCPGYLGGLDFSFKWNLGWMNDTLHYLSYDPLYRKHVHTMVQFMLLYAFHEHFILELSHDEVVHGKGSLLEKMPGDDTQKFAQLRLLYGFMYGHPGKKLLFMGSEFAQRREWDHDATLEWHLLTEDAHQGVQRFVRDLNHLYHSEPALYHNDSEEWSFEWIDFHDFEHSIFSFLRKAWDGQEHLLVAVYNFTPVIRTAYRIGVPAASCYFEILNSDASAYGGSNVCNPGEIRVETIPWQDHTHSISLTLPPHAVVFLKPFQKDATGKSPVLQATPEPEKIDIKKLGPPENIATTLISRPMCPCLSTAALPYRLTSPHIDDAARADDARPHEGHVQQEILLPKSQVARPQGSKSAILQLHTSDSRKSSG